MRMATEGKTLFSVGYVKVSPNDKRGRGNGEGGGESKVKNRPK